MNSKNMVTTEERIRAYEDFMRDYSTRQMLAELKVRGFFTAPASTTHHGNYEGGLFDHSLAVAEELVRITKNMGLIWINERSPYIVGMFHDLCKCDAYTAIYASPEEFSRYDYSSDNSFPGHGAKSVMVLSQLMQLTEEEVYCIRYHMGAYEKDEWSYYDKAIKKYSNVLWAHTADMAASKIYRV